MRLRPDMEAKDNKHVEWTFSEEELSAGVYRVTAVDRMGRRVERTGIDPAQLRCECGKDVEHIERTLAEQSHSLRP